MKKVLSKLKEHASPAHHDHDHEHHHDEGLKASLYDETVSKSPPRIGERPIKGNLNLDPSHSRPVDAPSMSAGHQSQPLKTQDHNQTGLAIPSGPQPIDQRHDGYQLPPKEQGMPTNFSRLSLGNSDGLLLVFLIINVGVFGSMNFS